MLYDVLTYSINLLSKHTRSLAWAERVFANAVNTGDGKWSRSTLATNAVDAGNERGRRWRRTRSTLAANAVHAGGERGPRWRRTRSTLNINALDIGHKRV